MSSPYRFPATALAVAVAAALATPCVAAQAQKQPTAKQAPAKQAAAKQAPAKQEAAKQQPAVDSVATPAAVAAPAVAADSATGKAPGKRSRFAAMRDRASKAADAVEKKTGVSKGTMAKAALAATGVGAAAMLVPGDSASPAGAAGSFGGAIGKAAARGATSAAVQRATQGAAPSALMGIGPAGAAADVARQQQMMQMQAYGAVPPGGAGMSRAQREYMQLVNRATAGDPVAMRQFTHMQMEMNDAMMRMQHVPPAKQQQAYEAAMEQALVCATTGKGCHTKPPTQ